MEEKHFGAGALTFPFRWINLIPPSPQRNAKNAQQNLEGNTTWITIKILIQDQKECESHSFISTFSRGFVHIQIKHCRSNSPTVFHKEQILGTDVHCLLKFICIVISKISVYHKHKHTKTCSHVKWGQESSRQGFLKHKCAFFYLFKIFYLYCQERFV